MSGVAISDRDRKILWARSGNRCALCRRELVAERTAEDPEAVVGEEAHIAGRSPRGPRHGEAGSTPVDAFENLILLCATDHKIVDDQPGQYTCERLLQIKTAHEAWVKTTLSAEPEPTRVVDDPSAGPLYSTHLRTGSDVWDIVSNSHAYRLGDLDDDQANDEELGVTAGFLQAAQDWGEISAEVIDEGMIAVRDATRSLDADLATLAERGLVAFGGRRRLILTGGVGPPVYWFEAVVKIYRRGDPRIPRLAE